MTKCDMVDDDIIAFDDRCWYHLIAFLPICMISCNNFWYSYFVECWWWHSI